jgi:hypothetical protein
MCSWIICRLWGAFGSVALLKFCIVFIDVYTVRSICFLVSFDGYWLHFAPRKIWTLVVYLCFEKWKLSCTKKWSPKPKSFFKSWHIFKRLTNFQIPPYSKKSMCGAAPVRLKSSKLSRPSPIKTFQAPWSFHPCLVRPIAHPIGHIISTFFRRFRYGR